MSSRSAGGDQGRDGQLPAVDAAFDGQPIGSYLRLQREVRGITAEELALQTRIPLRSLERLESGSFDGETDGFVRGFVRTVADALGLDPEDTVSRMLAEPRMEESSRVDFSIALSRALVGVVAVVLLAAAVGLVKAVMVTAERPSADAPLGDHVYRRDPVRALAESEAATGWVGMEMVEVSAPPPAVEATPVLAAPKPRRTAKATSPPPSAPTPARPDAVATEALPVAAATVSARPASPASPASAPTSIEAPASGAPPQSAPPPREAAPAVPPAVVSPPAPAEAVTPPSAPPAAATEAPPSPPSGESAAAQPASSPEMGEPAQ